MFIVIRAFTRTSIGEVVRFAGLERFAQRQSMNPYFRCVYILVLKSKSGILAVIFVFHVYNLHETLD